MNEWLLPIITIIGSIGGSYIGMKMALTRLETQMNNALDEIKELRRVKHEHAGFINEHEMRLTELERWRNKSGG